MNLAFRALTLAALMAPPAAFAQSPGSLLTPLLPVKTVQAEVLEMYSPPRLGELSAKLQRAAQADPVWWRSMAEKAQPGRPMPYDPKMGLTRAEYTDFLSLTDSVRMLPIKTVTLGLQSAPFGWSFPATVEIEALRGIEIDTVQDQIRTPYGQLTTRSLLRPSAGQRATGPWGGPQWKLETIDRATMTGANATFAVGRLEESRQVLIYFTGRQVDKGQVARQSSIMVRLPAD